MLFLLLQKGEKWKKLDMCWEPVGAFGFYVPDQETGKHTGPPRLRLLVLPTISCVCVCVYR